jgi:TRAP-type mannitol/chloroaromatic compound transport system permease large subunit
MSVEALAFVVFIAGMLVLMGIGMNMAFALLLTGAAMAWVMDFWDAQILAQNMVAGADSFPLMAVPFFMLAGELMNSGGISRRIVDMAQAWVGHLRGGLGYVAICGLRASGHRSRARPSPTPRRGGAAASR